MIADFETYTIEPITERDAWKVCDFITVNSERLKRFFPKTLEQNLTPTLSQIFVEAKAKAFHEKEEFLFKLREKSGRTIIGLVYIKELDWELNQGELAYCIGYQYQGTGMMTQAVHTLSKYAFEAYGLKKLQIIAHKTNVGSIKVAEKCGFIWKETLPNKFNIPSEGLADMELYERFA